MQRWILGVLVFVVALAIWALLRDPTSAEPGHAKTDASPTVDSSSRAPRSARAAKSNKEAGVDRKRKVSKAEREVLRQRILDGLRNRDEANKAEPDAEPAAPSLPDNDEAARPAGNVKDRTDGALKSVVGTINEDVMPLADECYQLALASDPTLSGMLDLNLEIIADEDVGGLVESVDLGEENEIENAEMTECVQETILSTAFPALGDTGRAGVRLTLRFEPPE